MHFQLRPKFWHFNRCCLVFLEGGVAWKVDVTRIIIFSETNFFFQFQKPPPNMSRAGLNMILKFVSVWNLYCFLGGTNLQVDESFWGVDFMAFQEKMDLKCQIITKTYGEGQTRKPSQIRKFVNFVSRFSDDHCSRNPNTDNEFLNGEQSSKSFHYTVITNIWSDCNCK